MDVKLKDASLPGKHTSFWFLMGFDINVLLQLTMCPETGKPFYYGHNKTTRQIEKIYDLHVPTFPEDLKEYLVGRGRIFHAYTEAFNEDGVYEVDVDRFLESYPSWDQVVDHENYYEDDCGWTQEDHDKFEKLLKFCLDSDLPFRVGWSY